jgi:hypothetical protein
VSNRSFGDLLLLKCEDLGWQLAVPCIAMAKLPLAVLAPTEHFAKLVDANCQSIKLADEAIDELSFVHE